MAVAIPVGGAREPAAHAGLAHIVAVMDRLRSPGGCAWDAVQTHESLAEYLIEETYELLDAIDSDDREHLREELGDVLLQVVFHCRIAQDDPIDPFDIDEVAEGIAQKLIRRHPHVFAGADAPDPDATLSNWEAVKAAEKGRQSPLDGVPNALPPMTAIGKIRYRADVAGVADAVAPPPDAHAGPAEAFGDHLLAQVLQAAADGIDAEAALRGAVRRARDRVAAASAAGRGSTGTAATGGGR
jgi:XTP/dITP diphosphohydrolase